MPRYEKKYRVPIGKISELREFMRTYVNVDPFASECKDNTYTVRSIYYDTKNMKFYREKIEGIRDRKKLRIRAYDCQKENSVAFLEIKRKNDAIISKNRSAVYYKNLSQLLATDTGGHPSLGR